MDTDKTDALGTQCFGHIRAIAGRIRYTPLEPLMYSILHAECENYNSEFKRERSRDILTY